MLHLSDDIHNQTAAWQKAGVTLPTYDIEAMRQATKRSPT